MNRLSSVELDKSLRSLLSNQFVTVISIIKGVTLGNAAFALVSIIDETADRLPLLILWTASMLAVMMTYQSIMIESIIVSRYPYTPDLMMPFVLGTTEFMLFSFVGSTGELTRWLMAFIGFHIVAVLLIYHVYVTLDQRNYQEHLYSLVEGYRDKLNNELKTAGTGLAVFLIIGALAYYWLFDNSPYWTAAAVGAIACVEMIGAIFHHRSIRQMIASHLVKVLPIQIQ